jgi:hypothetical protein
MRLCRLIKAEKNDPELLILYQGRNYQTASLPRWPRGFILKGGSSWRWTMGMSKPWLTCRHRVGARSTHLISYSLQK